MGSQSRKTMSKTTSFNRVRLTLDSVNSVARKVVVCRSGLMAVATKAIGKTTKLMVEVRYSMRTETCTQENGNTTKLTATENMSTQMAQFMWATGTKIKSTEEAHSSIKMETDTMATGSMDSLKVKGA